MRPAAALTTEALRLVEEGHADLTAFALATLRHPCAPMSQRLALSTFTAALRRRQQAPA